VSSRTKLELTWIGKENRPKLEPRILLEDAEKSHHAAHRITDHDLFDNRLIFGDNLLALKALEQEFAGKVKCVFIDPPYNTGSAFTHYDDGVEHSIWLSLMRDRLEIIAKLTAPGSQWIDESGIARQFTGDQILVVAPYNAQVSRLDARLKDTGARVGTVDKFQGQQAPIVIYSMATSRPEDAPRGLEFLYSLNRLNVATSRAQCAVILVASPHLLVPDCSTPRQMKLANALCRYRELAASPER
jgi:AAA domain/DNA methylase